MDNRVFANIFNTGFVYDFHKIHSLYFLTVYEEKQWGIENAIQRFEQCLATTRKQMPVAFTSLLIKKFTSKRMIDEAYDVANRTMKIIIDDVENDQTLPLLNRNYMVQQLKTLKLVIGYPNELLSDQNVENVYEGLNLKGNESLLRLIFDTYTFSKAQEFKNLLRAENFGLQRNESTRWTDYTEEDEYLTPTYNMNDNSICKNLKTYADCY